MKKKCDHIFKKQIKHWQEVGRATHILLLGHSSSLSVHVVVYNLRLVGKSRAYMYILSHGKIRIVLHTSKNTCVLGVLSSSYNSNVKIIADISEIHAYFMLSLSFVNSGFSLIIKGKGSSATLNFFFFFSER